MPVDFGLVAQSVPTPSLEIANLLEYNRAALNIVSSLFTTTWIEDHFQRGDQPVLEAWTTLSYLAAEFPHLKVAPIVLGQSYRNPALLAKMAATLSYLSEGRFIMGIGAGWKEDEYLAYGYEYPTAGVRIAELSDAIGIMRAMWADSPATYQGKHYKVVNAYCEPRPSRMIPIHVGGNGEKSTLRVVARLADAWNFGFGDSDTMRHKLDVLRGHCEVVGRDFNSIQLTYYGVVDLPDDPTNFQPSERGLTIGPTPEDAVVQLRQFVELGVSHILIRTRNLATLSRFVAEVAPALA